MLDKSKIKEIKSKTEKLVAQGNKTITVQWTAPIGNGRSKEQGLSFNVDRVDIDEVIKFIDNNAENIRVTGLKTKSKAKP